MDGSHELHYKETGPQLNHFRNAIIELDLINKWESYQADSCVLTSDTTTNKELATINVAQ